MQKSSLDLVQEEKEFRLKRVSSAHELKKNLGIDGLNSRINSIQNSIKNDIDQLRSDTKRF